MSGSPNSPSAAGAADAAAGVVCPQCGGENDLPSGERILACVFCGAALFVDRSAVVSHYRLPRLVDEAKARAELKRWMAGNETVKDLDRKSTVEAIHAVSFPMWMFRTHGKDGGKVYVEPAAPTPIPALADLSVPAGRLEPYRPGGEGGTAIEAPRATVPLETARGWLADRGVSRITETALVEVPLWRVVYRFGGHSFQALVEGSTGRVLAAVYPEKSESPYVLVALLGLVLFGLEGLAISHPLWKLLAYAVTAVPLLLLAWWVTRKV